MNFGPVKPCRPVVSAFCLRLCIMGTVVVRLLKIPAVNVLKIFLCVITVAVATGIMILIASLLVFEDGSVLVRLCVEVLFGAVGLGIGAGLSRYIVSKHPAVLFLADRVPVVAKFLLK